LRCEKYSRGWYPRRRRQLWWNDSSADDIGGFTDALGERRRVRSKIDRLFEIRSIV
jgi:hypothetical protein